MTLQQLATGSATPAQAAASAASGVQSRPIATGSDGAETTVKNVARDTEAAVADASSTSHSVSAATQQASPQASQASKSASQGAAQTERDVRSWIQNFRRRNGGDTGASSQGAGSQAKAAASDGKSDAKSDAKDVGKQARSEVQKAEQDVEKAANPDDQNPFERFIAWLNNVAKALWQAVVRFFQGKGSSSSGAGVNQSA